MVLVPLFLLGLLEIVLRLCGYGYSTRFFVKMEGADAYTTNPKFGWRFTPPEIATQPYPVTLPARKAPGTKRAFILGESAAQGTPVPAFGFSRILEVMLNAEFPTNRVEVVNVAMRGINSYAILPISQECAEHEPDLFIIYMGNNETVGLHAPKPGRLSLQSPLWMLRAGQSVRDSKLGQLMANLIRAVGKGGKRPEQDMEFFRKYRMGTDNRRKERVYKNFQANLEDILRVTQASRAKVVLCTVAANLADCPPLASLHRDKLAAADLTRWEEIYRQGTEAEYGQRFPEAVSNYLAAAQVDNHYAELHFRLARCHRAMGQLEPARKEFVLARDWDALQFRTDSRLNEIIRQAARKAKAGATTLVDVDEIFAGKTMGASSASDKRLFHEHVHLTFDGDYLLAQTVLPSTIAAFGFSSNALPALPSRQQCAEALGLTDFDEMNLAMLSAKLTSKPPFLDQVDHAQRQMQLERELQMRQQIFQQQNGAARALEIYRAALARRPNDWQMHMNFGMFLGNLGDAQGVVAEYEAAVKLMPVFSPLRTLFAQALANAGQREAAIRELEEVLRRDPVFKSAKEGLERLR